MCTCTSGASMMKYRSASLSFFASLLSGSFSRSVAISTARLRSSGVEVARFSCAEATPAQSARARVMSVSVLFVIVCLTSVLKFPGVKLPALLNDAAERRLRVVVEEAEPAFARGPREQTSLGLDGLDGVEVVAHHPRERHVRACRHEVGEAVERAAVPFEPDALHRTRVAGHSLQP